MVEAIDFHPFHGKTLTMLNTHDNGNGPENKWVMVKEGDSSLSATGLDPKKAAPFMFHKVDGKRDEYFL